MSALVRLTDQVWLYPRDPNPERMQPNVGVIVTGQETILVDAGNSPRVARRLLLALDEIHAPPVRAVIYTHHHWDHVFGGLVYDAPIIAHEICRKNLVELAAKPWGQSYIQEEITRAPAREVGLRAMARAVEDWRSFSIALPEITLSKTLRLYSGGLTIEIEHVGGQHAADSLVVRVPEARLMFVADACYPPPPHQRRPDDTLDRQMIERLADEGLDIYVDGHGDPRALAEFRRLAVE
ncbi:MAG: MBL fold metallo-hydrolase [Chloroflexi bacterium]|nr:MBL fold metallo-hydrolase [Chloroflexota bacterium]